MQGKEPRDYGREDVECQQERQCKFSRAICENDLGGADAGQMREPARDQVCPHRRIGYLRSGKPCKHRGKAAAKKAQGEG